ncbi:putative serine/threonine-protein kinase [Cryptosporidium canis]|uniref:Serine/threonine-protein kinase n=1 Tax=Cryptosporidium canis TaxID=195482 RepID=A0ABQ8P9B2_9CRYT|nr:putative serine/threonine-protein kinase [Cryptosporidium canis]
MVQGGMMCMDTENAFGFERSGLLWILDQRDQGGQGDQRDQGGQGDQGDQRGQGDPSAYYCLNNYAYDSSRDGFLGEGSYFRAYRGRRLFSFNNDRAERVWSTLKVGLISCLRSHKIALARGEDEKVILSVYDRIVLEYFILTRLSHPSIPRAFDLLEVPETNQIVLIHEYLPFQLMYWNSRTRLYSAIRCPDETWVYSEKASMEILDQLLTCVDYLHGSKVVHRDIKPENIFLSRRLSDSEMVLMDNLDIYEDGCGDEDEDEDEDGYGCGYRYEDDDDDDGEDDSFEDAFLWEDAPVFGSVSEAKTELAPLLEEDEEERRGLRSPLEQLLEYKEYRDYFKRESVSETGEPDSAPPSNSRVTVKLSDFNSCSIVGDSGLIYDSEGSKLFTPPECFRLECSKGVDGFKRDVWSIGCVMYCILNGRPPFFGRDPGELLRSIRESSEGLEFYRHDVSAETRRLIKDMLCLDPASRISVQDAKERVRTILSELGL